MQIKPQSEKFNADLYLSAAEELGLKSEVLNERVGFCRIYTDNNELYIKNTSLSCNDMVAMSFAMDKNLSLDILGKAGIPVPKQELFTADEEAEPGDPINRTPILEYAKSHFPLVVKPLKGAGGKGVFIAVNSLDEVNLALNEIERLKYQDVLIENYVKGKDYRILVANGKVVDILERIQAFVIGNGKKTVSELIKEKNKIREAMRVNPVKVDDKLHNHLSKQSRSVSNIPAEGEKVVLRPNCNFSEGGETHRIDIQIIKQDDIDMFLKVAKVSRLGLCAIDYITPDITKSYKEVQTIINEINGSPSMDIHYYADTKEDLQVIKDILISILKVS
ncbi:ATP-grasp domain-containing protein [Candidatus Dojkabacteria bacterium]|nr:ATP-grasp domain-containing protein [Candidatus Dojkabacteria bacterium]